MVAPWWWSSGQGARLLLERSESNPVPAYSFSCKMCVWKERKYHKKRLELAHLKIMVNVKLLHPRQYKKQKAIAVGRRKKIPPWIILTVSFLGKSEHQRIHKICISFKILGKISETCKKWEKDFLFLHKRRLGKGVSYHISFIHNSKF